MTWSLCETFCSTLHMHIIWTNLKYTIPFKVNSTLRQYDDSMGTLLHDCIWSMCRVIPISLVKLHSMMHGCIPRKLKGYSDQTMSASLPSVTTICYSAYLVLSGLVCLGSEHAQSLEGADCVYYEQLPLRILCSCLALFEEGGQACTPHGSGPASA